MVSSVLQDLSAKKKIWVVVPLVSFAGIIIGFIFNENPVLGYLGVAGCIISSFILGGMAFVNEKKDIVALLAPLYAVIIFNPWSEYNTGYLMQILYSLTILVVTVRFVLRFQSE
ncbi:hypothetical protein [Methanolacinia paynteri]|uniref:hypothetical protein n=1 Tax=Methanolacinia paynteri TaxID=230356 RepID=UPI00064F8A81|nr:hypothetical protein [Methanolacinia paynteri]